jgi:hypothetical protein
MFPALWPLLKTVFKILNRNVKMFFTDDLMSSMFEKHFPFSTHLKVLEATRSQLEPSLERRQMIHDRDAFSC